MDWLNLLNSEGNTSISLSGNPPTPRDNCGVHWCIVRGDGEDSGSCISRICWWTKGCFSDY